MPQIEIEVDNKVLLAVGLFLLAGLITLVEFTCAGGFDGPDGAPITAPATPPERFYTVDDGQTWFADAYDREVPFTKDGKEAVRVYVWTCDDGKTKFVSHLERTWPGYKEFAATQPAVDPDFASGYEGMEVKRPGEATWVRNGEPGWNEVITANKCPDGGHPKLWLPQDEKPKQ